VNADLARLYGLAGEFPEDQLVPVTLPESSARRGLLGTAAFLATNAIATRSSPTVRGVFVRERLLCQEVPPPPDNVTSDLRAAAGAEGPRTMRQRLAQHATDRACANCHRFFDPIGLPLEQFDALGAHRTSDDGLPLDVVGALDGVRVEGLAGVAAALRAHPRAPVCLTEQLYRYGIGHEPTKAERPLVDALAAAFAKGKRDLQELLIEIVASDGFRTVGAPAPLAKNANQDEDQEP
jgi:hypothetical protein